MENFTSLPTNLHQQKINQIPNKRTTIDHQNKPIKVKYISSPMMVKANNESEFRAIVQKLTGQHSSDDAFDQSVEEFNHAFYPSPSSYSMAAASFDAKDCYASASDDVLFDRIGDVEGRYWRGEMEGSSFSGFQASSCVNIW